LAQATRKRTPEERLSNQLTRSFKEVSVIGIGALSIYLFIALVSYHPDDPGWSHAVSVNAIKNSAGVVGAWIADVLLYMIGYLGYLIPVILAFSGWQLFQSKQRKEPLNYLRYCIWFTGLLLIFIGGCGLARRNLQLHLS